MKRLSVLLIGFYKRFISSSMPNVCIYIPTCSMYMLDAIEKYGSFKGIWLGIKRLFRCTPFHKGGYDPVPENYRGKAKWLI